MYLKNEHISIIMTFEGKGKSDLSKRSINYSQKI